MGAVQFWSIATLMVVAATATLVVPLFWRERHAAAAGVDAPVRGLPRWAAFVLAAALPLAALGIYVTTGSPASVSGAAPTAMADDIATQHARSALRGGGDGGDLNAATERLRARLAANPQDADGWRLLAQSYEFEGRTAEAAQANNMAASAGRGAISAANVPPPVLDAASEKLAASAQEHRRRREFPAAVAAFAALAKRGNMSADLWADYADALGGAHGGLDDEAATCIAAALRLSPDHPKALWLQGSLQTQRQDYAGALATWQRLAQVLPAQSPDLRIIEANLAEAREKLAANPSPPAGAATIVLSGSVRLDPRFAKRIAPGDVLFVFARAADERGPPLAVMRTSAGPWPVSFALDDRNAMLPDRKLSDFSRVILEARISHSGNALAQPGDLRAVSTVFDPHNSKHQQLIISEEVGTGAAAQGG